MTKTDELLDKEPDFQCEASSSFCKILSTLGLSIIATSYQSNRVFVIRSNGDTLHLSVKAFPRPMGLAVNQQQIVLGISSQIIDFRRFDHVTTDLEPKGLVTSCFVPRRTHVTGMINIHDIAWGDEGLWIVNSNFSCLSQIQGNDSFTPKWKPPFISDLAPEDRCHLNGMAIRDGKPRYVTCFNTQNEAQKWREVRDNSGIIMDVKTNAILVDGLLLPHSPRYHSETEKLYFCNSGKGEFCQYNPETGESKVLVTLPGFLRGMDFYQHLAFIGSSLYRESESRPSLALNSDETLCGIFIIDLNDLSILGLLKFTGDVSQIYDVAVADLSFTDLLQIDEPEVANIFDFPPL
ncbi:TIGR03032 family protein [Marinibactrum halimedae]|uniref:TIGR03032 family protein n=1 Tax=Marinibactrum halimedae TaxID=1444977 RepID=A0AA37TDD4_9GAMM|nr:TIGR03032 family protein [Marinibactrum halimedae]MCD9460036.1 TIGR03032 family protein [Marinibactrum halimedae]GLS28196.1 TIGR03032 family protein [Marinibactrum halimedae]